TPRSADYEARNGIPINCRSFLASSFLLPGAPFPRSASRGPYTPLRRLRGSEWHPDKLQELPRLFVGFRWGHDRHIHSASLVHLHVIDLRKDQLISEAECVVPASIKSARRHAFEIADARQSNGHQAVEKLPHPLSSERHHRRDRHSLADLERRNRLLCAPSHG